MGLYVQHLRTVVEKARDRTIYLYLLDYGWPQGEWEQLFKRHFTTIADMASEAGGVVIASGGGVHFGNEVLSWYRVANLKADEVLPALLITQTPPSYFAASSHDEARAAPGLGDLLVIPLAPLCQNETDFLRTVEGIFADLEKGLELRNFGVARHDVARAPKKTLGKKLVEAVELKPGAFGVSVNLKTLLRK